MRRLSLLLCALALALCAQVVAAGESYLEQQAAHYPVRWLWEPVPRPEPGSEGVEWGSRDGQGRSVLLQPGGFALLRLQGDYWLRLAATASDESPGDATSANPPQGPPELWISRGNGLFVPARVQAGARPGEWLLPPTTSATAIVLLENKDRSAARWQLSRAIPAPSATFYPYREPAADQDGDQHWYFRPHRGKHVQLSSLAAGDVYQVVLQGPGEWRLEASTLFDTDSDWQRFIDLPLQLNGQYWRDWRLHPVIARGDTLQSSQCEQLSSVAESLYITLPAGEHRITLTAPQPMVVRTLALTQDNFLFARNRPLPGINGQVESDGLQKMPAAQAEYDEHLFSALLQSPYPVTPAPSSADQVQPGQVSRFAAERLVERRYRFWRPLPAVGNERGSARADLIDVALREPGRGKRRYVLESAEQQTSAEPLLRLDPGHALALDTPDERPVTMLKLSLPVSDTPYDLILSNRRGEETRWRWRPALMKQGELDVLDRSDLARLLVPAADTDVATASATFAVSREDFPIRVSHSADHVIWFSPFYRENISEGMARSAWQRALAELGAGQMLELLSYDERPEVTDASDRYQQQRLAVWDDWQPLRRWLHSYQALWSQGLVTSSTRAELPVSAQLPAAQELLTGDSGHIFRQLLKGVAVRGKDPAQRGQALDLLHAHYRQSRDRANLSAYHSWRFHQAPGQHLQSLADWLLLSGLEAMAARLYQLAGADNTHLPYRQALLDSGWSQQTETGTLTATWDAIWRQDWRAAKRLSQDLDRDNPWRVFLSQMPEQPTAVSWLSWAQQAPASTIEELPASTSNKVSAVQSAGTLELEVSERDVSMQRFLALPDSPVRYELLGPVELRLTVNLQHVDPQHILDDWIEISSNGDQRLLPLVNSSVNPRLRKLTPGNADYIGKTYRASLSLGPGRHELSIRPEEHSALVNLQIESPLLLAGLINGLQEKATRIPATTYTVADLVSELDIIALADCEDPLSADAPEPATLPGASDYSPGTVPLASQWQARHTLVGSGAVYPGDSPSVEEVEQYLLGALRQWPQADDRQRERMIARANALAAPHQEQAEMRRILAKLNEQYTWQLEESITASGGSRRVQALATSEHPVVAARERLLGEAPGAQEERLDGRRQIGLFTRFKQPTEVRLELRQAYLPFQQAPPASVLVTLNDQPVSRITLPPERHAVSITVPAGSQQLRLQLEQPSSDHWLYVQARARLDGQWQSLFPPRQRRYQVATVAQPLEIYLPGPRWLRIDEYRAGRITHRYQWQASAGELQLSPAQDESRALYRVFSWQPRTHQPMPAPYAFDIAQHGAPEQEPQSLALAVTPPAASPTYRWQPDPRIAGSANATDGLYLRNESRLDLDSDAAGEEDERFFETGWRHRRALDCQGCFWRSDIFVRTHEDDDIDVFATRQWLHGDWVQSSWRWELQQSLWHQSEPETEWSWQGSARLVTTHDINEKLEHEYQLRLFGRHLSASDPDHPVDNDIYSRYKEQHRYGAKIGAGLRGRPWLDSLWTARASLSTNEDFNPVDPDYIEASAAWRQYWRPLAFTASYRHRLYLADDDRDSNEQRPALTLAVNALNTFPTGLLLHWDGRLDYDLDRGEYGFMLTLSFDQSRGRGLRDFYPGRSSFHALRSRDISDDQYYHRMTKGGTLER